MYATLIKEKKMDWGARVLVTHFPTHGSVSFVGSITGGVRLWGSEELADMHAAMLLKGTEKHSKKEMQLLLDSIGATLQFNAGVGRLIFIGRVRTAHLAKLLELIAECLLMPTFPDKELTLLKQHELANLALETQDTRGQAQKMLTRLVYPKKHPNYDESTAESQKKLSTITTQALRKKHRECVDRRSLVFAAAGDVTLSNITRLIDASCKNLPQQRILLPAYTKSKPTHAKHKIVEMPNKASIDYMIGMATGITDTHPAYAPLLLGMQVLGNRGFTSRLMSTVREEEGLTYGVYGYMAGFRNKIDGYVMIWGTFAPELFKKGRTSIMRQIKLIVEQGVTEEEVRKHRELFEARSRVQLSNSGAFASTAHSVIVEGQKISYLDEFPKKVLKLKAAEVNRALKKYLIPKKLSEAAAGPIKSIS